MGRTSGPSFLNVFEDPIDMFPFRNIEGPTDDEPGTPCLNGFEKNLLMS